jgi:hypothetical protein
MLAEPFDTASLLELYELTPSVAQDLLAELERRRDVWVANIKRLSAPNTSDVNTKLATAEEMERQWRDVVEGLRAVVREDESVVRIDLDDD